MAFGTNLSNAVSNALGSFGVPSALQTNLQPNAAKSTTATSLLISIEGIPQGLLRSANSERPYDQHRVKVIGSSVDAAIVPGVTEPTLTISKVFLFGLDLNAAMGGNIRPVQGKRAPTNDFTSYYFQIIEIDALGNTVRVFHDCALSSESTAVDIDSVLIMETASVFCRWIEDGS
jgi:hypothetical protein